MAHDAWGRGAALSPWYSEGQAQWYEAGTEGGLPRIALAMLIMLGAEDVVNGAVLADVLSLDNAEFASSGNGLHYGVSALLYAWLATERPELLAKVEVLERAPGVPTVEEFAAAAGEPLEATERAWRAWIAAKLAAAR
jgi:hypothetical protein